MLPPLGGRSRWAYRRAHHIRTGATVSLPLLHCYAVQVLDRFPNDREGVAAGGAQPDTMFAVHLARAKQAGLRW